MIWSGNAPQLAACRVVALSALLATPALAQSQAAEPAAGAAPAEIERVFVHYDAPADCPSQALFEGALLFRSRRLGLVTSADAASVEASVRVTPGAGGRYQGALLLTPRAGSPSERTIEGPRCATLVEALSLAAVLLLDPEGVRTAPLPTARELESLAEQARAEAEPAPVPETPPPAQPSPPPVAPASPPPPRPAAVPAPVRAREAAALRRLGLGAHGGATTAFHGIDAQAGLVAELGVAAGAFELAPRLMVAGGLERRVTSQAGSVTYLPLELRAGACFGPSPALVELAACADASLVFLSVDAPEADEPRPSWRLLPGVGLAPRIAYRAGALAAGIELGAGLHVSAERFRIEPDGEVFRLPRIYGRSILFLRLDVPLVDSSRAGSAALDARP